MTNLKETAKNLFLRTLKIIEPESVINQKLRLDKETLTMGPDQIPLDSFNEVVLIGMGKASLKMGMAIEGLLGARVKRGILVTDRRSSVSARSEVVVGGHPLPDANSLLAGEKIVELVGSCGDDTLIIFLVSGGGSALVELPASRSISLDDLRVTNEVLIRCGATIREINLVRKSLSAIKGGRLGWLARKSKCVGLYISDVNPGDLRSIASNPLLPEEDRSAESIAVVKEFNLAKALPRSVLNVIQSSPDSISASAVESGFRPITMLLLDNSNAVQGAAEEARRLGFQVRVATNLVEGEYRAVADQALDQLVELKNSFPNERVCVISGGEVSCLVRGIHQT